MKNFLIIILFMAIIIPIGVACSSNSSDKNISHYTCPMHPQIHENNPGQCPICGMDLIAVHDTHTQADQIYTCPMHPEVKEHEPGQCPICNMNLVLQKTEKKSPEFATKIDPEFTQLIGVKTEKAQTRNLVKAISTHGKVAHDAKLWVAQNEYIQAVKLGDTSLMKSAELKLEYMGLSKEWIALLKEKKQADLSLHLEQKEGPSFFEAYIYQSDISLIKEGQDVAILDQKGRYLDTGKVMAISTMANLSTHSIRILIESSKYLNLKLNTFVRFQIKIPLGNKLSITKEAILFNGDHNMVYVQSKPGHFMPTVVELGEQAGNFYEILSGVTQGQLIVSNGTFLIDSETQIKMGGMSGHNH
ncbi:MAG: heavy metal-binding domain-containing protein [bacterium]|nr:hypothetical protein [bacterium]MBU1916912.1 hypothetical protein [bacterium]